MAFSFKEAYLPINMASGTVAELGNWPRVALNVLSGVTVGAAGNILLFSISLYNILNAVSP